MAALISIVIPVKNGAATLGRCLRAIYDQTLVEQTEVIIIDSGSTDDTLSIVQEFPVRLFRIGSNEFNHGTTRNYGVSLANGNFVVMTVQDAFPADSFWLERMFRNFEQRDVAAVCGKQIVPHNKDKNPHEWFRPQNAPGTTAVHFRDPEDFQRMKSSEKREICAWDNVSAMYRKEVLEKVPFQEVSFGEDMLWARSAVLSGYKLVYDESAKVEHYHHSTFNYHFRRTLTILYHQYKFFGYIPEWKLGLSPYLRTVYHNVRYRAGLYWIYYQWRRLAAAHYAFLRFKKYLGRGDEALDSYHFKINKSAPQGIQTSKNPILL